MCPPECLQNRCALARASGKRGSRNIGNERNLVIRCRQENLIFFAKIVCVVWAGEG